MDKLGRLERGYDVGNHDSVNPVMTEIILTENNSCSCEQANGEGGKKIRRVRNRRIRRSKQSGQDSFNLGSPGACSQASSTVGRSIFPTQSEEKGNSIGLLQDIMAFHHAFL